MPATVAPPEQRVLLRDIRWETYERLIAEAGEASGTRFAFDHGELEIMTVSIGHEAPNRDLAAIAEILAEETGRDFLRAGSTTFKREELAKGFEPDSSFYFRESKAMRGKEQIDLATDPPPELIIEVAITRSSLNRFAIFAGIGVAEIWRYDGERVRFHSLTEGAYREIPESVVLPPMTSTQATAFVDRARQDEAPVWLRSVREWIRSHA
jgi:Uma2 family endonuclease